MNDQKVERRHRLHAIIAGMNSEGPFSDVAEQWIETGEGDFPAWSRLAKALAMAEQDGLSTLGKEAAGPAWVDGDGVGWLTAEAARVLNELQQAHVKEVSELREKLFRLLGLGDQLPRQPQDTDMIDTDNPQHTCINTQTESRNQ